MLRGIPNYPMDQKSKRSIKSLKLHNKIRLTFSQTFVAWESNDIAFNIPSGRFHRFSTGHDRQLVNRWVGLTGIYIYILFCIFLPSLLPLCPSIFQDTNRLKTNEQQRMLLPCRMDPYQKNEKEIIKKKKKKQTEQGDDRRNN